jgi:ketosteroid isomerase-like protein
MKSKQLALALAVIALAGCDRMKSEHKEAAADPAAIERELKTIESGWEKDYQARDVDKAVAHYSDDAAVANPGMALASDEVARKMAISQFLSDPTMKITFASDKAGVAQSGELAYTRGHYAIDTTDPKTKQPKTETGSYLTVWKKQADGSWKAVEDFVTPGAPAAQ